MAEIKEKPDWKVICIGILCLTIIEIYALSKGINGIILSTVIGIIGLSIGITIKNPLEKG